MKVLRNLTSIRVHNETIVININVLDGFNV